MIINKYYTPSLEEFYVGFWCKKHIDPKTDNSLIDREITKYSIIYPLKINNRLMIIGYENEKYITEEELLILSKVKNYNELKQVMKFLNII